MTPDERHKLLTLAAKSAGINIDGEHYVLADDGVWNSWQSEYWNPIESSADCGELEAKLMISIVWSIDWVEVSTDFLQFIDWVEVSTDFPQFIFAAEDYANHNGDRQAARRIAVTKLAAKIGGIG